MSANGKPVNVIGYVDESGVNLDDRQMDEVMHHFYGENIIATFNKVSKEATEPSGVSDGEIKEESMRVTEIHRFDFNASFAFELGAKWAIEKMRGK